MLVILLILFSIMSLVFLIMRYYKRKKTIEHFTSTITNYINNSSQEDFTTLNKFKNNNVAEHLLDELHNKNMKLISILKHKYPNKKFTKLLSSRYKPKVIKEVDPLNKKNITSFVENKGSKIGYCIRKKTNPNDFVDQNTLMYVNLHELAHLSSSSYGHGNEFLNNFILLLNEAVENKIYNPVNYNKYPQKYCGILINNNILYP